MLIKFNSPTDRNLLLKATAIYRKQRKAQLCLRDVNIQSDAPMYLRESLTKQRLEILHAALKLKKLQRLSTVFTMRGCVYIKRSYDCRAEPIDSIEKLESVATLLRKNVKHLT